ncbi:BTAD domain-containing putative transcriptional regulator [Streptomyces sp. NPDC093225]|uniref:AfsR/SARP family transcriptional regulator n=1 Tax=Streptomyces sp. NPDC093225 TaxID=3366034 RepID=UPI0037F3D7CD
MPADALLRDAPGLSSVALLRRVAARVQRGARGVYFARRPYGEVRHWRAEGEGFGLTNTARRRGALRRNVRPGSATARIHALFSIRSHYGGIMQFRILGPLEIETLDGQRVSPRALKLRSLLAYLCMHSTRPVSMDRLIDALWSGTPPQSATTALHVYVSQLRKYLSSVGVDPQLIVTQPPGYRLDLCSQTLDLRRFESLLCHFRSLHAQDRLEEAAEALNTALALWRGPALEDLRVVPFFHNLCRQLNEKRAFAYEQKFEIELKLGRHNSLIGELYSLIDEQPTRENLYWHLMIALYRSGRIAESLAEYGRIRKILVQDLGVEPGLKLQKLHRAILAREAWLDHSWEDVRSAYAC